MKRHCKNCGGLVNFGYEESETWCYDCDNKVTYDTTIATFTVASRIEQLRFMHTLMCLANDENIYYGSWIYTVPDEPSEDDFLSIAVDDEEYNEVFDLFVKLIAKKGNRY